LLVLKYYLAGILVLLAAAVLLSGCTSTQTQAPVQTPTSTPTPTPTLQPTLTQEEIEANLKALAEVLEADPAVYDAAIIIKNHTASVAIMIINPAETERVFTYTKTTLPYWLKKYGANEVLIGIYKGDQQLKLEAMMLN
jgi:hypothetical protein